VKIFFRKTGEGKPLIILHGVFGMSDNWMTIAKELATHNFSVYTPDARNHGRSPHHDEFTFEAMAEDILELMNDEKISMASLIGHSMGGRTAMVFSSRYPERVDKLIVVDMSSRAYPSANQAVMAAMRTLDLKKISSRKEAEKKLQTALNGDATTTQFLLKSLYWKEGAEKELAWRFNLDAIEKNMSAAAEPLNEKINFVGPTLFIRGAKSNYITSEDEPLIKQHFPEAIIKTVPDAGHWIHAENPKGFMDAVLPFLSVS
jgi:esterase